MSLTVEQAAGLVPSRRFRIGHILNITVTVTAAGELRERLLSRLGGDGRDVPCSAGAGALTGGRMSVEMGAVLTMLLLLFAGVVMLLLFVGWQMARVSRKIEQLLLVNRANHQSLCAVLLTVSGTDHAP